ncbi:energy transducer TonB [Terrimonas alba]|uniref:energy transducer TonB n=1 Tax=Terrimonas alba TaxID=3349636 RepID=UPI0035F35E8D
MDTNKILSADLLDLVFDNRNKDYGAYELRKTYHTRITRSLIFTGVFTSLIFAGVVLANKERKTEERFIIKPEVTISTIEPDLKQPDPLPEPPPRQAEPQQIRTEQLTNIVVAPDDKVQEPPPSQDDLSMAKIDVKTQDGIDFNGIVEPQILDDGKGIIENKVTKEPEGPLEIVEIPAKFDGDWIKFLERNLNGQVAVDNNAPAGRYTVIMQFVVDVDGSVSDIKPLTNIGYGLEQEAIRVLKKAKRWDPAIQNGHSVKAYRRQPITFQVASEE